MGAALEIGKITAAVWLKINWARASWTYKFYLVPAVAVLMLLTSMGIFGFLSKAHSEQNLISGDTIAKVSIVDEKINTQKENISLARRALEQLDKQVEERLSRGTTEQGVERAAQLRRQQQAERTKLQKDIQTAQNEITKLNEERAPLAAAVRKVENEVGPIKYIAALIYGDNADISLLEKAVRWVIIIIVAVFDPLALVLILAAQQSIKWALQDRASRKDLYSSNDDNEEYKPDAWVADVGEKPTEQELASISEEQTEEKPLKERYPYLFKPWVGFPSNMPPMVYKPEVPNTAKQPEEEKQLQTESIVNSKPADNIVIEAEDQLYDQINDIRVKQIEGDYYEVNDKKYSGDVFRYMYPGLAKKFATKLEPDNVENTVPIRSSFGTKFPDNGQKGDMFLRVDMMPNRLYKFNGNKWIEVDKDKTDSYTYDEQYILYLIEKLQSGEYEIDQLNSTEQDLVAQHLQKINAKT
jgi:hypothetical protein